jgi:hypothetical protein
VKWAELMGVSSVSAVRICNFVSDVVPLPADFLSLWAEFVSLLAELSTL